MAELNPAIRAFVDEQGAERLWGQVLIRRESQGFSLRHSQDQSALLESLKPATLAELRKIAGFDASGQFRPLRLAPDLRSGWIHTCSTPEELWRAIQEIYPGSISDWYAVQKGEARVTDYRQFSNRQTGMYRITQLLSDAQASQVTRACCAPRFCLKRRFWTVEGLPPDRSEEKSLVPCLEPCAVLLELARKAARIEQEEKQCVQLPPSDWDTLISAARRLIESGTFDDRAGNMGSATNRRRIQLVVEKYTARVDAVSDPETDSL